MLPRLPVQLSDLLADNCHLAQRRPYSQAVKSAQARTAAACACAFVDPLPWPSWKWSAIQVLPAIFAQACMPANPMPSWAARLGCAAHRPSISRPPPTNTPFMDPTPFGTCPFRYALTNLEQGPLFGGL